MSTQIQRPAPNADTEPLQLWLVSISPMSAHGSQQGVVLVLRRPSTSVDPSASKRSLVAIKAVVRPDSSPQRPSPTERWG